MTGEEAIKLANEYNIKADFTEEEKQILIEKYNSKELNQYYLAVINKVLTSKDIPTSEKDYVFGLLSILTTIDLNKLHIKTDDNIIEAASTLYKVLMVSDITGLDSTQF